MTDVLITPHFSRNEFTRSQVAARYGLVNQPSPEDWQRIERLCQVVLEPARAALGPIHVSSGFRSVVINGLVGGKKAPPSQHTRGEAADIEPEETDLLTLFKWIVANVPFDQCIWEFDSWVHVSHSFDGPHRGQVLRAWKRPMSDGRKRTTYIPITPQDYDHLALTQNQGAEAPGEGEV